MILSIAASKNRITGRRRQRLKQHESRRPQQVERVDPADGFEICRHGDA
jgi:hypothetical protein